MQIYGLLLIASACLLYFSNSQDMQIPPPEFCKAVIIPQRTYSDDGCHVVLASPCHCQPPLRTHSGSRQCEEGGNRTYGMALRIGSESVLSWDQTQIDKARFPEDKSPPHIPIPSTAFASESGDPAVDRACKPWYKWGDWEAWSEWTLFYNSGCYKQRRRSRPCIEIPEPQHTQHKNKAHHCDRTIGGNVTDARTEEDVAIVVDTKEGKVIDGKINRDSVIKPNIGERLGRVDYVLLCISVAILILIIVALVLIVKLVKL